MKQKNVIKEQKLIKDPKELEKLWIKFSGEKGLNEKTIKALDYIINKSDKFGADLYAFKIEKMAEKLEISLPTATKLVKQLTTDEYIKPTQYNDVYTLLKKNTNLIIPDKFTVQIEYILDKTEK